MKIYLIFHKIIKTGGKEEDLYSLSDVENSYEIILNYMEEELSYLNDSRKLYIGGFSQGCAMSLYAGIKSKI